MTGLTGYALQIIIGVSVVTAVSLTLIGAFIAWSWIIAEVIPKAILSAKVWHRLTLFVWYYDRGLKEKLDELDKAENQSL